MAGASGGEDEIHDLDFTHTDEPRPHLRIHAVNIFVRDQDSSLEFYLHQLGFDLVADTRLPSGQRFVAVAPPDGTAVLRLIAPDPATESYKLIGRSTQVVFLTDDVLAKYREWRRRGVRFRSTPRLRRIRFGQRLPADDSDVPLARIEEQTPVWGGVFARFEDLDGNSFALVGFDEVSQQLEEQRKAAAERLEAERRVAQEIEIARQVQARLFPQSLPRLSTLVYAGVCQQARRVGGDYYDFLNLGQEQLGLVIGDIAGKGIAAALLMANLQANVRSQCAIALDQPQQFLESLNQLFFANTNESAYATLFFAGYDDRTRRLRYANCGHLPALLLRRSEIVERLDSTATVLGLFQDWSCSIGECQLSSGDTLVLYTDGVTESFNDRGEEFGEQRLTESLRRYRERPPDVLLASVLDEVQQFGGSEQQDDITLIVARCE
jgi:serine phosphatase RsbU (regulator of sigma subunit)/catechol 2,3-dioxygenase-like lactoylglutathione lyase family enzyme